MNLIGPEWGPVDYTDLALVLEETYHVATQLPNGADEYPYPGSLCHLRLTYESDGGLRLTPGPAFDASEWKAIERRIREELLTGAPAYARAVCFSSHRVLGTWRGSTTGIQILPAPPAAPESNVESGDHPFTLEVPITRSSYGRVTNLRRSREIGRVAMLLNVLLEGRLAISERARSRHVWAILPDTDRSAWLQESYFFPGGFAGVDDRPSPIAGPSLVEVVPTDYLDRARGLDGRGLEVPANLDELLVGCGSPPHVEGDKFTRSAYWFDLASRQWDVSQSASFVSLVTAVESLLPPAKKHSAVCSECGEISHDVPSINRSFRDFLERFDPGELHGDARKKMYALRSRITHGSGLFRIDTDSELGLHAAGWSEFAIHTDLWRSVRRSLNNWLIEQLRDNVLLPHDR